MIPVSHGPPCLQLVPFLPLWRARNGGFCGRPSDGEWLGVWKEPAHKGGGWVLTHNYDGEARHVWCELSVCEDDAGETFLQGRKGLATLVVKKMPRHPGYKGPPLRLYWGAKVPANWVRAGVEEEEVCLA